MWGHTLRARTCCEPDWRVPLVLVCGRWQTSSAYLRRFVPIAAAGAERATTILQGAREHGGRPTALTPAPRAPQYTHSHPEPEPEPKPYPGSCGCPSEPVFMWRCSRADKCVAVAVRSQSRVPGMGCTCVPGQREAAGDRPGGHQDGLSA